MPGYSCCSRLAFVQRITSNNKQSSSVCNKVTPKLNA